MIEADDEQEIKEEVEEEDADCILMDNDEEIVDDIEPEFDDYQEVPIIIRQDINEDYNEDEEEEEEEDEDEEGYLLLKDVLIVDDIDSHDFVLDDMDPEKKQFAKLDQTARNTIIDDDEEMNELQDTGGNDLQGCTFETGGRLKIQRILQKVPDSVILFVPPSEGRLPKGYLQVQDISDSGVESNNQPIGSFVRDFVTAEDDPDLVIGELVPPPDAVFPSGYRIPKARCFFKCNQCGHLVHSKNKLKTHFRKHTRVKPFPCSVCKKTFRQSHHVREHLRIHTGERPYPCSICDKTFVRSHHLKRHLASHDKTRIRL